MGARAGSGSVWGGGLPQRGNVGFSKSPFSGAAKAGSLKAGDRLIDSKGNISKVVSVTNKGKTKVNIKMQWEKTSFNANGNYFGATMNKNYYLGSSRL